MRVTILVLAGVLVGVGMPASASHRDDSAAGADGAYVFFEPVFCPAGGVGGGFELSLWVESNGHPGLQTTPSTDENGEPLPPDTRVAVLVEPECPSWPPRDPV